MYLGHTNQAGRYHWSFQVSPREKEFTTAVLVEDVGSAAAAVFVISTTEVVLSTRFTDKRNNMDNSYSEVIHLNELLWRKCICRPINTLKKKMMGSS